jgi:acetyl esterase/lipase
MEPLKTGRWVGLVFFSGAPAPNSGACQRTNAQTGGHHSRGSGASAVKTTRQLFVVKGGVPPRVTKLIAAIVLAACCACRANSETSPLSQARNAFKTHLSFSGQGPGAPAPPAAIFRKITYSSPIGPLGAYLTLDPKDGSRQPAIIWITGGDCNSIGDVWSASPRNNDQTAAAYRKMGIVMMFPSLRGGNDNPGRHEGFYGEVDDVLAAYDYLSSQPYVDPTRIYLGGHSTGATLVLLTAETRNPFRAVFAFGPVGDVSVYGRSLLPVDFSQGDQRERTLRSPGYWLPSARGQVFVIEGTGTPSNISALEAMRRMSQNPALHFIAVAGATHFSVLAPSNEVIARKILNDLPSHRQFEMAQTELQPQFN